MKSIRFQRVVVGRRNHAPSTPLLRNATVNVRFVLGVEQMGAVRFCVVAEMLRAGARLSPITCFIGSTEKVMRVRTDFNGDGLADIAMYRPSTGQWSIRNQGMVQFGEPGDVPVTGDYDGDGKDEGIVYFRPSTGVWSVMWSGTGFTSTGHFNWGAPGDVPLAGDFDGDGRTDMVVLQALDRRLARAQPVHRELRRPGPRPGRRRLRRRWNRRCGGLPAVGGYMARAESDGRGHRRPGRPAGAG